MAYFDDMTEQEIRQNKAIRGYIVRALAKGNQNSLLVRQITNALLADNLITVPDISKQLSYLEDGGYGSLGITLPPCAIGRIPVYGVSLPFKRDSFVVA